MKTRRGFTVVELLVVLAIIGLLAGLILAAVQYARESARRARCISNLRQIGVGLAAYHQSFGAFPAGVPPYGFSPHAAVMAQMGEGSIAAVVDRHDGAALGELSIAELVCTSDLLAGRRAVTNYASNYGSGVLDYGYNGLFRPSIGEFKSSPFVSAREVTDGLSNTAAMSEILVAPGGNRVGGYALRVVFMTPARSSSLGQLAASCTAIASSAIGADYESRGTPWMWGGVIFTGYNHVLTPNQSSCTNQGSVQDGVYTSTSAHPGGVNTLAADGRASFCGAGVDLAIWRAFGSRNGGEAIGVNP